MCKAKTEGGRRCACDWRNRSEKLALRVLSWETTAEEKLEALKTATHPRTKAKLNADINRLEIRAKQGRQELEDMLYAVDETPQGQAWLQSKIDDPETGEEEREVLRFRLGKARENRAAENRFISENAVKIGNTERAMEQAGFSEEDRDAIRLRYLSRGMNKLPYSTREAEAEKWNVVQERRALVAKVSALKSDVDKAEFYDPDERLEAKREIDAEHAGEMAVLDERLRLAKQKYDATPAGLVDLQKGYERFVEDGQISKACELMARMNIAEREIRNRNDERNTRASMKRAVRKAAKKAGVDPSTVWDACKSITPVNLDGTPLPIIRSSDETKAFPTVHLTASDWKNMESDVRSMEKYREMPVQDAVKDLMRKRIMENPVSRREGTVADMNSRADLRRDGTIGRYRTKQDERRDVKTYPPLTNKEYARVTSMAKTLEMTPASYMRAMALGKHETPFAIQNDRSMRTNWARKIAASENFLAQAG